jgi:hypothetical protein
MELVNHNTELVNTVQDMNLLRACVDINPLSHITGISGLKNMTAKIYFHPYDKLQNKE